MQLTNSIHRHWFYTLLLGLSFLGIPDLGFSQTMNRIDSLQSFPTFPDTLPISNPEEAFTLPPAKADFLFSYYKQEGDHSAVTGGEGSEELRDIASKVVVYLPIDTTESIGFEIGVNHYTSASTDRIDPLMSSASYKDYRGQMQVSYTKENPLKRTAFSIFVGGSIESDYISANAGFSWSKTSKDKNREWVFTGRSFLDNWVVLFPNELRPIGLAQVDTDKRRSFSLGLTVSQIINKRLQASLSSEVVYQYGLLSTPFHRVYFHRDSLPSIERLPKRRIKLPIGIRLHYFATDFLVLRLYYRYYYDSFGIHANTVNVETPIKIGRFISVYPFYRFHTQQASRYFQPLGEHAIEATYYTSDYDLSGFSSHKVGLGIKYAPLYGILRFKLSKKKLSKWKSISIRYAQYRRTDGLRAFLISSHLSFEIE